MAVRRDTIPRMLVRYLPVILVIGIGIVLVGEWASRHGSLVGCQSDYLGGVLRRALKVYASDGGYYPTQGTELELNDPPLRFRAGDGQFVCPTTSAEYQWVTRRYRINDDSGLMLVWDSEPHGFLFSRWYNVVFVGGKLKRIPKEEFQKLLGRQQTSGR